VPVSIFEFGDFRLDCNRFELWRAGVSIKLERKPMELLILLATREGDLVTRTEIAEHLWGNEVFGDPGRNYFANGMTDELTTMLAKNSTLRITSRTSAMQYKGAHRPLLKIAEALDVDGIMEGSVKRSGDKVHMTIQLIQADTDTHVWAESYDRNANDVVTLPEEAEQAIAERLNSSAPLLKPARYVNPEAHDAYLRGMYLFYTNTDASASYFRKAIELQPDYAPSWAGLALYYGSGVGGTLDPTKVLEPMEPAARKAVDLDDTSPEAHLALGVALFCNKWDWAGADRELLCAIELDPQYAEAIHRRASFLAALNRHQEAIAAQKTATEIDAFARPRVLALSYVLARQYDAAIADIQQRLQTKPNDEGLLYTLYVAYRCKGMKCKGMKKETFETLEQYIAASGDDAPRLEWKTSAAEVRRAWEQGGYNAILHAQISDMERKSAKQYVSPVDLALLYAQLGQREKTLTLLEAGLRERNPELLWIQCDPAFDFLHSDERYRTVIRRIGLPPAWS
jgi:TolB-like protein